MPLYGQQTKNAIENFPISGWPVSRSIIRALACIKEHAAIVNGELGMIPKDKAKKIAAAAAKVQKGKMDKEFPVDVFQTGSGTSTNMNVNEVIATLAGKGIHSNDHVNCGQSTNDTFPSAVQIACATAVRDDLLPAVRSMEKTLQKKAKQCKKVVKTGRTHLMDAVPISLGDEFGSYAALAHEAISHLESASKALCVLPLGGTAVGTGINTHPSYSRKVISRLAKATKLPLKSAKNRMALQSCPLSFLRLSSALRETGVVLNKVANDIQWMATGPTAGLSELSLPELQRGSSIMPGKVNPVLCESVQHVSLYVIGADATVQAGVHYRSIFELNTALPIIAQSLIVPIHLLTNVTNLFTKKYLTGLKANTKVIAERTARNPMLITALAPHIGYEKAAEIAKESLATGKSILDVAQKRTDLDAATLKKVLDPQRMV